MVRATDMPRRRAPRGIAAHDIDRIARSRPMQEDPAEREQRQHREAAVGQAENPPKGESLEVVGNLADRGQRIEQRASLKDRRHA